MSAFDAILRAVTLPADLDLERALVRLEATAPDAWLVIDDQGDRDRYHVLKVATARALCSLGRHTGAGSVRVALRLDDFDRCPPIQVARLRVLSLSEPAVVLDGARVLGVVHPERVLKGFTRTEVVRSAGLESAIDVAAPADLGAYPSVDAPPAVAPGGEFVVRVGLRPSAQVGVVGGPMVFPNAPDQFDVEVRVLAPGFQAPQGSRRFLHVVRADPFALTVEVPLVAPADQPAQVHQLQVDFVYEGQTCGSAWRGVYVGGGVVPEPTGGARPIVVSAEPAADLEVTIRTADAGSSLHWSFASPHPVDAALLEDEGRTDLGAAGAEAWAVAHLQQVDRVRGKPRPSRRCAAAAGRSPPGRRGPSGRSSRRCGTGRGPRLARPRCCSSARIPTCRGSWPGSTATTWIPTWWTPSAPRYWAPRWCSGAGHRRS